MLHGIRRRLSFANVMSTTALMVALGGTSYAAVKLPKNSVTSTQIKAGAVAASDIRANAITGPKVKNGSLGVKDFAANQIPQGPKGDPGAQGVQGKTGTVGTATVQYELAAADLADGMKGSYDVFCPSGQQAIAGGVRGDDLNSEATSVTSSRPAISSTNTEPPLAGQSFTGWRATVTNLTGLPFAGIRPEVWVVCVAAPS